MKYDSVLDAIGNTPLIKLSHISPENGAVIYGKFEGVNIGGSIKTRTAYEMICKAEADGILKRDMTIVEATSGNQGVGLALVGAIRGYKVLIIMPDSVSEERRKIITQYGATVELVHDNDNIGECIARCKELAEEYAKKDDYYLPAQFENPANVEAQKNGFCAGVGTGGTLTGIGTVLREHNPDIEIWAVEPDRAAVLSGSTNIESHLQMGIGDGIIPAILDQNVYDRLCMINDDEAIAVSKMLALKEGILAGISSGTNVAAALKMAQKLGKGKIVVTVLPDTGERYYSTPLFE